MHRLHPMTNCITYIPSCLQTCAPTFPTRCVMHTHVPSLVYQPSTEAPVFSTQVPCFDVATAPTKCNCIFDQENDRKFDAYIRFILNELISFRSGSLVLTYNILKAKSIRAMAAVRRWKRKKEKPLLRRNRVYFQRVWLLRGRYFGAETSVNPIWGGEHKFKHKAWGNSTRQDKQYSQGIAFTNQTNWELFCWTKTWGKRRRANLSSILQSIF